MNRLHQVASVGSEAGNRSANNRDLRVLLALRQRFAQGKAENGHTESFHKLGFSGKIQRLGQIFRSGDLDHGKVASRVNRDDLRRDDPFGPRSAAENHAQGNRADASLGGRRDVVVGHDVAGFPIDLDEEARAGALHASGANLDVNGRGLDLLDRLDRDRVIPEDKAR